MEMVSQQFHRDLASRESETPSINVLSTTTITEKETPLSPRKGMQLLARDAHIQQYMDVVNLVSYRLFLLHVLSISSRLQIV